MLVPKFMKLFAWFKTATKGGNQSPRVLPLHRMQPGRAVRVRSLATSPEITCRLREIGLCEGQIIRLIACHTNIICTVCNARLALNSRLAEMILVESVAD